MIFFTHFHHYSKSAGCFLACFLFVVRKVRYTAGQNFLPSSPRPPFLSLTSTKFSRNLRSGSIFDSLGK